MQLHAIDARTRAGASTDRPYAPRHRSCQCPARQVRVGRLTRAEAEEALRLVLATVTLRDAPDRDTVRALQIADATGQATPYDALYLYLAERAECEYWTADDWFAGTAAAQFPQVKRLGGEGKGQGVKSAGVAREYRGTAGRIENCQIGVFLYYASRYRQAFLDRALYLPKDWAGNPERRREAGIPDAVEFATKGELAREMLARAFAAGAPAQWVTADEVYGNDGKLRPVSVPPALPRLRRHPAPERSSGGEASIGRQLSITHKTTREIPRTKPAFM